MKITISDEMLDHLAMLSRLQIEEGEREGLKADLQEILSYMQVLEGVEEVPVSRQESAFAALREDVAGPSFSRDALLKNAASVKDGAFQVPRTVE